MLTVSLNDYPSWFDAMAIWRAWYRTSCIVDTENGLDLWDSEWSIDFHEDDETRTVFIDFFCNGRGVVHSLPIFRISAGMYEIQEYKEKYEEFINGFSAE